MDAFYATVEQRDNPDFLGKPVIVGANPRHGRGRGVVSTASYEARKYGIHSAQPISQAYRLCPNGIFLPVRGKRYVHVSRAIMAILREYSPVVETVSLDEAFLDVTGTERLFGHAEEIGKQMKVRIKEQERLTASVGIGPNKLVAKIASDLKKPDGFVVVGREEVRQFLSPLPVSRLWGIGKKTEEKLANLGITTIGELALLSKKTSQDCFGKLGVVLWQYAQGIDDSPVISSREAKSISNELTFQKDVTDIQVLRETLLQLSEKVGYRLRSQNMVGRTVTLKIRWSDFSTYIRHKTYPKSIFMGDTIYAGIFALIENIDIHQPVRLLGVGVTQLSRADEHQMELFGIENGKSQIVDETMDRIKNKFGEKIIGRGLHQSGR
ncbi:DNA polymerase IV [bacterium]|nr:DNA polymerase IV [bacterium]RQV95316.1 MAG: DNA polymerase IV [bacterium]